MYTVAAVMACLQGFMATFMISYRTHRRQLWRPQNGRADRTEVIDNRGQTRR